MLVNSFATLLACGYLSELTHLVQQNMTDPPIIATTTNTEDEGPSYLRRAQQSSHAIQRSWIRSVLREAAASALRKTVVERTLQQRRDRAEARQYDDGSISSIEDEPTESAGRRAATNANDGDEVDVTQADIDASYAFAERVGRKWAECLRRGQEGHDGLPSSADIALEVVQVGKFLEEDDEAAKADAADAEGVGTEEKEIADTEEEGIMEVEDSTSNAASASASILGGLAGASDAITPEVAISRLITPPALLIGSSPFGTLAEKIPPNPVLSASLATTMINASAEEIKAENEKADAWRRNVGQQMVDLIDKNRWLYPKSLLEKTVQYNRERMASSRVGASTTAEIASGRKLPSSAVPPSAETNNVSDSDVSAGSTGRKRQRLNMNARTDGAEGEARVIPRPPCSYSELEWTGCELSKEEQRKLDKELLHEIPEANEDDAITEGGRSPPPLPPSGIVTGPLRHFGNTQLWEKAGARGIVVRVPDPLDDVGRAKRRRKRLYRQAKTERLGYRLERPNDARLEIDARLSKVVKATNGEKEDDEGGAEYFEMDLGGCLLQVEGDDGTQRIMTFKSLEVSLSLNSDCD